MFFPRQSPPVVAESKLLSLRVSLNTPILATEQLAPGPAEAAILVLIGADGAPSVTVSVRSVKGGGLAFYVFEGPLEGEADLETALDGALSFGESMGFLFDDDALGQGDATSQRMVTRWMELIGETVGSAPAGQGTARASEAGATSPAVSQPELVLDRPVEPEPAPAVKAPPPAGPPPLTKFRRTLATPGAEKRAAARPAAAPERATESARRRPASERAAADGDSVLVTPHGPAVGRVQLVKQRRDEAQATPLDPLLRLLALL